MFYTNCKQGKEQIRSCVDYTVFYCSKKIPERKVKTYFKGVGLFEEVQECDEKGDCCSCKRGKSYSRHTEEE